MAREYPYTLHIEQVDRWCLEFFSWLTADQAVQNLQAQLSSRAMEIPIAIDIYRLL